MIDRAPPSAVARPILACVALLALAAGCSEPESPFRMWDMRIGMPFTELDSISLHDQQARFTCARSLLGYRTCSVPLRGSPGRMDALVDSTGRVVELTFRTGLQNLTSNLTSDDGRSYDMLMGLVNESHRVVTEWRRVTDSDTVFSPEVGWTETWLAGEGRWRARVVWQGTRMPNVLSIADAEKAHAHALALATAESGGGAARGASEPGDEALEPVLGELRRLVEAQRTYRERTGQHADALAALHFIPREDVLVEIGGARAAGWWARGWSGDGTECVVWDGVPPPRTGGFDGREGEPVCP